ncbi:UDP-N-acetylmuramate--L-alanine ligase [Periweissella ghanensis]|uniref:UDP-N-acetylmuramate--L-alanine ligase n=1 Tax=Periweissella ghanensis TaxID=467997 RepID=A0ABM8ZBE0_9LACO|nr:UDP-N-acetylmuramate--L-alanine ligase [Periweissella ghanensis]MCM0600747.1 UDP-N-acetylmuramate--L-alanine ligase [Periweissella ghanensis]CAH0418611.1 UDP-N-acetylmuramate--L-alanine ligase [Periweissella ghanensis]
MTNKYYFIGIKGSGMASLALILHDQGYEVAGSDITEYTFTQTPLEEAGIPLLPFDAANLTPGWTIIRGNSFEDDQVEVAKAIEMGLTIKTYPEMVEQLVNETTSIGVAGAHGKTSTTGLLAHVLSGVATTNFLIGDGTGKGMPDARFFAFEMDEYRRHFMDYTPDYAIMTNIDFDHPDYYTGIDDVRSAFQDLANQVKKAIFAWGDDVQLRQLKTDIPVYYYGLDATDDFQAKNIVRDQSGATFDVYYHEEHLGQFKTNQFGQHGILNTLAVIAVAYFEKLDLELVKAELLSFSGVKRRFQVTPLSNGVMIDDYAHHPSEIKATIDAARQKFPTQEIVAIFQPHTFSRTQAYFDDYVKILGEADKVFLTEIFTSARETSGDIKSADIGAQLANFGGILHEDTMDQLLAFDNAVYVFMGAGDLQKYEAIFKKLLTK